MPKIAGTVIDETTGKQVEARVQVLDSTGHFVYPENSILKIGPGLPFFYSDGRFEVEVACGKARVLVERGTEFEPSVVQLDVPSSGTRTIDVRLKRWTSPADQGWHPGNTHIHYDERETRPDERLHRDPRVEDLRMTAVSILKRGNLEYATNRYPVGMLTEFSSAHHYVQCGEEFRHNREPWEIGFGHIMLLNIRNVVGPVSTGLLVDQFAPDYPPLCYACDDARRQGGIVIWCHNGKGMEAPVAAALGKMDAFNLFDPHWMDPEYEIYYRMLNAGIRLPASTGSDWFISSANRVYARTGGPFAYESWLEALKGGRTFITNGPVLLLSVAGREPGSEIPARSGQRLPVTVEWSSHYPVHEITLLANGHAVSRRTFGQGSKSGTIEEDVTVTHDGWIAARASSDSRDSFFQPVFAHTSPVYLKVGKSGPQREAAAARFVGDIDESLEWVRLKGRYYTDSQRKEVQDLFREAQGRYRQMTKAKD